MAHDNPLPKHNAGNRSRANGQRKVCKDLAAYFTIIRKRGICLCGEPIMNVFAEVPGSHYWDSLWYDIEEAEEEITEHTMYLTLNLARVLAYKEEGLVLSKKKAVNGRSITCLQNIIH